ncbi:HD-GYP domain-containing protein [Agrobacterium tumefaciens]|uniref:HD-GYP domain-containing protein n=1 Tax=Agrobacterium tumefaciens TaxID=358 RepID=UPI0009BFFE7F
MNAVAAMALERNQIRQPSRKRITDVPPGMPELKMKATANMLKRIMPKHVRLGMFVEAVDGNWNGQRFWRSRYLLSNPGEVEALKASQVEGIIINTGKGADVVVTTSVTARCRQAEARLAKALQTVEQSKPVIKAMFEDARMGRSVPIGAATEVVEQIATCMTDSSRALIEVTRLKTRDEYTFLHSLAVTALMVHLGRSIKIDENAARTLAVGGLMHDIGKVKLPLEILTKTGKLSDQEMALIRKHPQHSHDLLMRQGDVPDTVLDICLHHHERLDGKGYPKGLSGKEISLPVRIASICDVYDALTSKRAYKKAWVPLDAAKFMLEQEGQFDRPLLKTFLRSMGLSRRTETV